MIPRTTPPYPRPPRQPDMSRDALTEPLYSQAVTWACECCCEGCCELSNRRNRPGCSSVSTAVSSPVRSAVSPRAHHRAMIRFRSTHDDHLTSVSPRTTRYLATIEAARARHGLDDVARLPSHGHFERSPLCNCISMTASGTSSAAARRVVCKGEGGGWRQAIHILDSSCALTRAWAAHASSPSRRDSSSSRLPAGSTSRLTPRCRDDPCPSHSGDR